LIRKIKVGRYLANLERFGKYATTPESHNHSYQYRKYREDLHDFTPRYSTGHCQFWVAKSISGKSGGIDGH
jgi:hypothetical protein